jgi:hypothetical protein
MLIDQIKKEFVEKKNKAAATRARKAAGNLKKLMTPYKKENMAMAKKMKKK